MLLLLLAVVLIFLVARAAGKNGGVLVRNQEFGARFLAGSDPYFDPARGHRIHGPYPPTMVWIAAPLALLPTLLARIAWAGIQAGALCASAVILRRWTRAWSPSLALHFPVFYAIAMMLASRYILRDTAGGGANLLHAALALYALDAVQRGCEVRAGLAFAFSLACKPFLAPLFVYFAARERWRTIAATAGFAALLYVVPAFMYGPSRWFDLSKRWVSDVSAFVELDDFTDAALVPDGLPSEEMSANQSLGAAMRRAFAATGSGGESLHASFATWTARALVLILLAVALRATRRAPEGLRAASAALAWIPVCLLASPLTWKAHHVLLLPLFYVLACAAYVSTRPRLAFGGLALYWFACDLLSQEIVGHAGKLALERISIVTWADVILFACAVGIARAEPARRDSTVLTERLAESHG